MNDNTGLYMFLLVLIFSGAVLIVSFPPTEKDFGPVCLTTVDGLELFGHISHWDDHMKKIELIADLGEGERITHTVPWSQVENITVVSEQEYVKMMRFALQVEQGG